MKTGNTKARTGLLASLIYLDGKIETDTSGALVGEAITLAMRTTTNHD